MLRLFQLLILTYFLLLFASCHSKSGRRIVDENQNLIKGYVIGVIDGDTYDLLIDNNLTVRIRMEGIDAPEKGMPFYRVAKNYLSQNCFNKEIRIQKTGQDDRGRILAFTFVDNIELSHEMINAGLAWHFKKYNSDPDLALLETEARKLKKGLWNDNNPIPPWEIRKIRRQGISTKNLFGNTKN